MTAIGDAVAALSGIKRGREKIVLVSGDNDFGDVRHYIVVLSEAGTVGGDGEIDNTLICCVTELKERVDANDDDGDGSATRHCRALVIMGITVILLLWARYR